MRLRCSDFCRPVRFIRCRSGTGSALSARLESTDIAGRRRVMHFLTGHVMSIQDRNGRRAHFGYTLPTGRGSVGPFVVSAVMPLRVAASGDLCPSSLPPDQGRIHVMPRTKLHSMRHTRSTRAYIRLVVRFIHSILIDGHASRMRQAPPVSCPTETRRPCFRCGVRAMHRPPRCSRRSIRRRRSVDAAASVWRKCPPPRSSRKRRSA